MSSGLSDTSLAPLKATSVKSWYVLDRPLQFIATRYTVGASTPNTAVPKKRTPYCLVFITGISLNQETWIPLIKNIFRLAAQSDSTVHIISAWVVERPNHGESGLLNATDLKEHYSVRFRAFQYTAAIRAFLTQEVFLIPEERKNLIGIGHSGGAGSLILAFDHAKVAAEIPFKALIHLEGPIIDITVWPYFIQMYNGVKASNAKRPTYWKSKEEAMAQLTARNPWRKFHPDVLRIVYETYFVPDPDHPGHVTTKTTVEQETSCFVDDGTHLAASPYLLGILHMLPTHLVYGSIHDLFPEGVHIVDERNVSKHREKWASVTTVEGAGHYLPVQMPEKTAEVIVKILSGEISHRTKL